MFECLSAVLFTSFTCTVQLAWACRLMLPPAGHRPNPAVCVDPFTTLLFPADSVPVHHSHHEERLPAGPEEPQQQLRAARPITWLQQLSTESLNDKLCSENVVFSSHV